MLNEGHTLGLAPPCFAVVNVVIANKIQPRQFKPPALHQVEDVNGA